jgi:hypothetical protein
LQGLNLGQRVAEEEASELANYFVETEQWRQIFSGDIDIVYGPKGSGKSAIYSLLIARESTLFDRGILPPRILADSRRSRIWKQTLLQSSAISLTSGSYISCLWSAGHCWTTRSPAKKRAK